MRNLRDYQSEFIVISPSAFYRENRFNPENLMSASFAMNYSKHALWRWVFGCSCLAWLLFTMAVQVLEVRYSYPLLKQEIRHDTGCAYVAELHHHPLGWPLTDFYSDTMLASASGLILIEDGVPSKRWHALHEEIRSKGLGHYSHWNGSLYFSATDCADPRTNGKVYTVSLPVGLSGYAHAASIIALAVIWLIIRKTASNSPRVGKGLLASKEAVTVAVGAYGLLYLATSMYSLSSDPARIMAGGFGTARAPYSDALGPWLQGGLHSVFGLQQISYLYRPTVGLFWGSIIAITNRLEFIPLVFLGMWFVMAVTFLTLWRNTRLGVALAIWMLWLATSFDMSIAPLSPLSLTVDFAAFALTLSGIFLIASGAHSGQINMLPCLVGGLVLGVAAAIRGPMIAGGFIFILCIFLPYRKTAFRVITSTLLCFLLPIICDVVLQRHYHVLNNGLISIFCVYSDPSHTWNGECHSRFVELHPAIGDILQSYTHFIASTSGVTFLLNGLGKRLQQDMFLFSTGGWALLLLAFSGYAGWETRSNRLEGLIDEKSQKVPQAHALSLWSLFVFWSFFFATRYTTISSGVIAIVLLCTCLLMALRSKDWLPLSLILAYMGGCAFLTFLGFWAYQRMALTFSFLLHIGALLLIARPIEQTCESPNELNRSMTHKLSLLVLTLVAGLYTCWGWWPSELRTLYSSEVKGRKAALKISNESVLDRSLYFTGAQTLVYAHFDEMPVGSVRRYKAFKYPDRFNNQSFTDPNAFIDE